MSALVSLAPYAVLFLTTFFLKTISACRLDALSLAKGDKSQLPFHSLINLSKESMCQKVKIGRVLREGKGKETKGSVDKLTRKNRWELWQKGRKENYNCQGIDWTRNSSSLL